MTDLVVDFCDYKAAKWAVEHWHYSKSMPAFKRVTFGVWEDGAFIGSVVYSWGANRHAGDKWGMELGQIVELVRVALNKHTSPVSQIVSITVKMLKKQSPNIQCLLSYADPEEGHNGSIYQAMNWIYVGESQGSEKVWYRGRWAHKRTVDAMYGNHKGFKVKKTSGKHTYLYPLDKKMRRQLLPLAQPYPKKETMLPVNGDNLATSQAGQFDSDPEALILPGKAGHDAE
jgi:hypothetical protein